MNEVWYRLKETAFFIARNVGKITGGILGMFALKSSIAFFILVLFGNEFDKAFFKKIKTATHAIDRLSPKRRIIFIRVFYNVMGHVAKADGRVSKQEIDVAQGIMGELNLNKDEKELAIRSFNDGKDSNFPLAATLQSFYKEFRAFISLREWFVRLQIQAALAGDGLSMVVVNLLNATAAQLDIPSVRVVSLMREATIHNSFTSYGRGKQSQGNYNQYKQHNSDFERVKKQFEEMFSQQYRQQSRQTTPQKSKNTLAEAYTILGVSAADDHKHIKRAYRRLISQHHPDKVIGQGGGKSEREFANAKTIEIRQAYELIKEHRKF